MVENSRMDISGGIHRKN